MVTKDYYKTLGVGRNADLQAIKSAYRKLAREHHPDLHPGDGVAEARFKAINEAYEVLSDPEKRRLYDLTGSADGGLGARRGRPTATYGGGGTSFRDVFDQFFRRSGGGAPPPRAQRGRDIEQTVEVTLEQAFSGDSRLVRAAVQDVCLACEGAGLLAGQACSVCKGLGVIERPHRVEVKIPPGVRDGQRLRIAGGGAAGAAGGRKGDLYVTVHIQAHPLFERREDDLYTDIQVPVLDAILGGEVLVPTLKGSRLALRIPPLTQNERVFRLAGQGMPHQVDPKRRGDLFARAKVRLPEELTPQEQALYTQLRALRGDEG